MKRVYTDMVADLFHAGHVSFLQAASELGDYLIVGLHSDATTKEYKRSPIMEMSERAVVVQSCRYVDEVILNVATEVTQSFMEQHAIDLVVHAHAIDDAEYYNKFYQYPINAGKFVRLNYTQGISSSEIIQRVLKTGD